MSGEVTQLNQTVRHRDTEHQESVPFDTDTAGNGSTKLCPITPLSPFLFLLQSLVQYEIQCYTNEKWFFAFIVRIVHLAYSIMLVQIVQHF